MRWAAEEDWVFVTNGKEKDGTDQVNVDGSLKGRFNFLLYTKVEHTRLQSEYVNLNLIGGQSIVWCRFHQDRPLIREGPFPKDWARCCVENCRLHGIYRCAWNMRCRSFQCVTATCRKHFQQISHENTKVFLQPRNYPSRQMCEANESISSGSSCSSTSRMSSSSMSDEEREENTAIAESMTFVDTSQIAIQEYQSGQLRPVFQPPDKSRNNVRSTYILNNLYQVMSRSRRNKNSPLNLQRLMQSVFSSSDDSQLSILFLEAELFPVIFPYQIGKSIVGALPQSMYINPILQWRSRGLASLAQHIRIRCSDYSILTSVEPDYLCWSFDTTMNFLINFNTIPLAIKKGPEFLRRTTQYDGIEIKSTENQMMFDVIESRGPVNELSALVRDKGLWTYFVTLTCNDAMTPGVCSVQQHLQSYKFDAQDIYEGVTERRGLSKEQLFVSAAPVLLRAWQRFIKFFWIWLVRGPEQPLGKIKSWWYR